MYAVKKSSKGKIFRIVVIGLLVMFVLASLNFVRMRHVDKTAWPTRDESVDFGLKSTKWIPLPPKYFESSVTNMPSPSPSLVEEYRRFQKQGISTNNVYPEIEKQLALAPFTWHLIYNESRNDYVSHADDCSDDSVDDCDCVGRVVEVFDNTLGSSPYNNYVGRLPELFILAAYKHEKNEEPNSHDENWMMFPLGDLLNMPVAGGGGVSAQYAALNCTMTMVRSLIMHPIYYKTADAARSDISMLRNLEDTCACWSLSDAIRCDKISVDKTIGEIYVKINEKNKAKNVVKMLGGSEEKTHENMDALFSRLIVNAALLYSPEGITAGLPKWCSGKGRIPWTRDHIGASVAQSYLRHVIFAAAVEPSIVLELRAARIAIALEFYKSQNGIYPETLRELIEAGLLIEGDIVDPFAVNPSPLTNLSYAKDGDGWRFWSVGLNQKDDGGLFNAFHASKNTDFKKTDFIFTSRERELRVSGK